MAPSARTTKRITVPRIAGLLTAALGLFVLLGWALGVPRIKSVLPGAVEMKANTAVGLLLAGVALGLLDAWPSPPRRRLGQALSLAVAALGFATLAEYGFGWQLGIDEILFRDTANAFNFVRGRMSPYSAVAFATMGLGLAALPLRALRWFVWLAASLTILIGGVSFIGYVWNASEVVTDRFLPPVALNSAIAFLLLGAGTCMAALPDRANRAGPGSLSSVEAKTLAGFLAILVLLLLVGGHTYRTAVNAAQSAQWVAHTQQVRANLGRLYASVADAESQQRNYLLSGDPDYLKEYKGHADDADQQVRLLAGLVADNPRQLQKLRDLHALIGERIAALERSSTALDQSGLAAAQERIRSGEGRRLMAAIRDSVERMDSAEEELLKTRSAEASNKQFGTLLSLLTTLAVSTAGFMVLFGGIRRELTVRRQAEESLRRSEENLAVTLNSIGDGMLATDAQRRVTRLNPVAERLTGWTLAEAAGRSVDEVFRIVNEETRQPAVVPVDAVLATGEIHGLANHTALVARDGTERPIADSAAPIRDREGRILGVVLVFRDLTAERAAEQELARFFSLSLDFLCIASADGYFKRVSPAVTDILGWSAEEFRARPFIDFIHPDDHAATLREVERQVVAGEKVLQFENRYRHKDGSWRVLSWRSVPQPGGFMYATARDVTEKNEAALALQRAHADLALANAELAHANAELARASQLKDEFLANMSHELRTPLNGIIGMNDLLRGTELTDRQRKYVEACSSSGKLLLQLINDILDLSKIEAGRLELDLRECDMEALVYDVADMMLQSAVQKRLGLRCRLAPDVCVIGYCDDNRLRQVLVNLVNNGLKFTSAGSVTINGTRTTGPDGSVRLRFSVADTGIGIPTDRRDRLFQAFSQVDTSTTRHFGGTGLGLSICRQLVVLMGGEIGVESKVGVGSTFWFEIPVRIISENAGWERKRRLLAGTRILAVDCLGQERQQITDCLDIWGCPLEQVATCAEALDAIAGAGAADAGTPFKIVLADYRLVTGGEYIALQQLAAIPDVCVIGVGSPSDDTSAHYLRSLGVRHVLPDPVRPSALLDAISSVLSVRDGTEADTEKPSTPPSSPAVTIAGHVLVAEDNRINQLYIVELLKDLGCTVDLVTNGDEALAAVQRQRYDLVLMDCQMPETDGFAATREIRKREAGQVLPGRLPVLALTANALKGDRERCVEAGMDDYVSKPVDRERLRKLLEKYLGRPPRPQTGTVSTAT